MPIYIHRSRLFIYIFRIERKQKNSDMKSLLLKYSDDGRLRTLASFK